MPMVAGQQRALTANAAGEITAAIKLLQDRMTGHEPLHLDYEEALQLALPHKDLAPVLRANEICVGEPSFATEPFSIPVPGYIATLRFTTDYSCRWRLFPKKPAWQEDAPDELKARVISWASQKLERQVEAGRLMAVFKSLNELCTSPKQMRVAFPGIVQLLRMRNEHDLAEKIADMPQLSPPPLSPEVRGAVRKAQATLTLAAMLPEPEANAPKGAMTAAVTCGQINEDGFVFNPA